MAIAAALVHRPQLLLLDEPTSQLDPVAGDELIWLLRRLNEEWGTAVVIAEHRLERCLPAADRVIAMEGARVRVRLGSARVPRLGRRRRGARWRRPSRGCSPCAGLGPLPVSVKEARLGARRRRAGAASGRCRIRLARRSKAPRALAARGLWHEIPDGPQVLRGLDLQLQAGERVALMGRNGAGKSTLLRLLKGLAEPTRGRIERAGEVALLLQNPGDYLIHEHAREEAGEGALAAAGLEGRGDANPRDLSGGERQRLALEVVLATGTPPAVVLLDEPTRGMDTSAQALAHRPDRRASRTPAPP